MEVLDLEKIVMEIIYDEVFDWKNEEVWILLGRFFFFGEMVFKKVVVFSGGEKVCLVLVKMLFILVNFLIFDELINYLDIFVKEMLEEVL